MLGNQYRYKHVIETYVVAYISTIFSTKQDFHGYLPIYIPFLNLEESQDTDRYAYY
jgi:hypothetical protein